MVSIQNMSYIVITAHFINDHWCLNRKIIGFSVTEDHRRKMIHKKIIACLQDCGIEKLFAIIVDNTTKIDVAISYINMKLLAWKNDDALVSTRQYIMHIIVHKFWIWLLFHSWMSCMLVLSLFGMLWGMWDPPPWGYKHLNNMLNRNGNVVFYCPTRCNSTYLTLVIALKLQATFDRMTEVDKLYEAYFLERENNNKRVGLLGPRIERMLNELWSF